MSQAEKKGLLVIISGPSGVGKGAISNELMHRNPQYAYSVSATTRPPRFGEVDGINYYFVSKKQFLQMKDNNEFLEWAEVYDNFYGTPCKAVEKLLMKDKKVILELDTQGAMQVKSACPEGIFIFVLPPSLAELRRRITARKTDDPESIEHRLSCAENEIKMADQYDYTVINDELETAAIKIEEIIQQELEKYQR
ncbi:MAG: guanylate kinase [Bacillota bacterium]|jgi:guanylate kinase